jgi:hypothetical protein
MTTKFLVREKAQTFSIVKLVFNFDGFSVAIRIGERDSNVRMTVGMILSCEYPL